MSAAVTAARAQNAHEPPLATTPAPPPARNSTSQTVYPLFPAITESHWTVGYGRTFGRILVDAAFEHALDVSVTNPNADPMQNPFGPDDDISHAQNTVHVALTYKFHD